MTLSSSLIRTPSLDAWIKIQGDGQITISTGKVELGQKIRNAIAVIAAEEMDVRLERINVQTTTTGIAPDERYTGGSNSLEESGLAIRQASAHARKILLELASEYLAEPPQDLIIDDGEIRGRSNERRVTYWSLMGDKQFNCDITHEATTKTPDQYQLIGNPVPGNGFEALVTGAPVFVHDMELPRMVHARVIRPPNYLTRLVNVDETPVRAMTGVVDVIRDGSFLAVAAEREEQAVAAAAKLKSLTHWEEGNKLNSSVDIFEQLVSNRRQSLPVVEGIPQDSPVPAISVPAEAKTTLKATYLRPYQMHGSIGPSAAMALYQESELSIWNHSQGPYPLRSALADVLEVPEEFIKVTHVPGPGCYGHNGADDVALDAALVARALKGRPVLLKWERDDEHAWEPYGSAMRMEVEASVDESGQINQWSHETYSDRQVARPGAHGEFSQLLAAWHLAHPRPQPKASPNKGAHAGIHRNAEPIYAFSNKRIVKHLVDDLPLRVSALRSLGAYGNVFALESFIDELAHHQGMDPFEFRMAHLTDERARAVLEAAVKKAGEPAMGEGRGQGFAIARYKNQSTYAGVVIDLSVDDIGQIQLHRAVIAADAGQIVDPKGLSSQLEGGLVQSASWTLKEQVTFDSGGITSRDWETYPILKFREAPVIETVLIDRPGQPFLGAGEATQGPTAAAIGNAVFNAIGIRLRKVPFTPENIRQAAAA
jgi:nicotinate dehydrogenase subunit B